VFRERLPSVGGRSLCARQRALKISPMETNSPSTTPARRRRRRILLLAGPVILIVVALFIYVHGGRVVPSDNAYVHADKLTVTSEVAGIVNQVAVRDNEQVNVGQVLFRLDDEPYRIAVAEARAQLDAV